MGVLDAVVNPLSDWDNMPLSHARIGYENRLISSNVTDAEKALTKNTYERWFDGGGAMEARFQLDNISTIDYIAIGAHNLGTRGSTVSVSTAPTVNGTFTERFVITPADDEAIMVLLGDIETVADVKVTVTNGADREIGLIYCGKALQMYQPIYGGHSPIDLSQRTEYQSVVSETGQFLGRTITRKGIEARYSWQHLDPDWYREKFQPFVQHAVRSPFFIKWRPDRYETTALGYTNGDIRPTNMGGGHSLMSVGFQLKGHADI